MSDFRWHLNNTSNTHSCNTSLRLLPLVALRVPGVTPRGGRRARGVNRGYEVSRGGGGGRRKAARRTAREFPSRRLQLNLTSRESATDRCVLVALYHSSPSDAHTRARTRARARHAHGRTYMYTLPSLSLLSLPRSHLFLRESPLISFVPSLVRSLSSPPLSSPPFILYLTYFSCLFPSFFSVECALLPLILPDARGSWYALPGETDK